VNEILMGLVLDAMAFFELVDEDDLDDRATLKMLEWMSYRLYQLEPQEREEFARFVEREAARADEYPRADGGPRVPEERRRFLHEFVEATGLLEPDDEP
jgi:hypothetical protein